MLTDTIAFFLFENSDMDILLPVFNEQRPGGNMVKKPTLYFKPLNRLVLFLAEISSTMDAHQTIDIVFMIE